MASIVKKRKLYYVVYYYVDSEGKRQQKWESFATHTEAKRRKLAVEYEQQEGTFVVPTFKTVAELLEEFVEHYGVEKWSFKTYQARQSIMRNYIIPYIGDIKLSEVKPKTMDYYYQKLRTMKMVGGYNHKESGKMMSARTIREIHKIL